MHAFESNILRLRLAQALQESLQVGDGPKFYWLWSIGGAYEIMTINDRLRYFFFFP